MKPERHTNIHPDSSKRLCLKKPGIMIKGLVILLLFGLLSGNTTMAQVKFEDKKEVRPFLFDEIPVFVMVPGFGSFYLDILYTNNNLLYLNVEELFKTLKISCKSEQNGQILTGFIENENNPYTINFISGNLLVGDKVYNSREAFVMEMGSLYMESALFQEAFGFKISFDFRSLSIQLQSNFELPVVKIRRQEQIRNNISKLSGTPVFTPDTILKRVPHLFKAGNLDWSFASTQLWQGATDNQVRLSLGSEFLYGEATVAAEYNSQYTMNNNHLNYQWRWVDNDKKIIRQAMVGKIYSPSISFLKSPLIGAVIRNSPTTLRKTTGYYTLSDNTEPNWIVELYVNNILVDYARTDASGLYVFKVPIVYGFTTIKLKFYGPLGEERTEERSMNTPYTIMPAREFEYALSGGVLQDNNARFGRADFNYGVNRFFTLGGGFEYLSSISGKPSIPYLRATIQPLKKMTLNAEYANGVRTRGLLFYYFGKSTLLEMEYANYVKGQQATVFNAPEERKVKLTVPFRSGTFNAFAKLEVSQLLYSSFNYTYGNLMLSAFYKRFSGNISTQVNQVDNYQMYVTSDVAISYRLNKGFTLRPSVQYSMSNANLMMYKMEIEKRVSMVYFSLSYQKNITYNNGYLFINLKYDLPFARTGVSSTYSNEQIVTSERIQGSLAFGGDNNYVYTGNNSAMGKGGLTILPFLDLNNNGRFDQGEHKVKLNRVAISGGKALISEKDSILRVPDLNAFTSYNLEFFDTDLENIAWRFAKKKYSVIIDPHQFKSIYIPIIAVGEISGMVYFSKDDSQKGIGRILLKFYNKSTGVLAGEVLSESDGYYNYLGLPAGEYIIRIDETQLSNLGFSAEPNEQSFKVSPLEEGDIIKNIDFNLRLK